ECAGVGFRAHVSAATRKDLPPEGESCFLRTYLHFREGGGDLFGFSTETEREIFLATIGVSGVGPKSALAVLSVLEVAGVLSACAKGDAVPFTRVPGIGKKLAHRIAMELPDRLKKAAVDFAPVQGSGEAAPVGAESQAAEALAALGFSRGESQLAIAAVRREAGVELPTDALLREALRRLSGGRA
ncbi:MAG: Holliday junction branch migration protein RuvA, partial [Verrucomicrobiota bacterium]